MIWQLADDMARNAGHFGCAKVTLAHRLITDDVCYDCASAHIPGEDSSKRRRVLGHQGLRCSPGIQSVSCLPGDVLQIRLATTRRSRPELSRCSYCFDRRCRSAWLVPEGYRRYSYRWDRSAETNHWHPRRSASLSPRMGGIRERVGSKLSVCCSQNYETSSSFQRGETRQKRGSIRWPAESHGAHLHARLGRKRQNVDRGCLSRSVCGAYAD